MLRGNMSTPVPVPVSVCAPHQGRCKTRADVGGHDPILDGFIRRGDSPPEYGDPAMRRPLPSDPKSPISAKTTREACQ